jgi:predicted O-methyltransferase YrrM
LTELLPAEYGARLDALRPSIAHTLGGPVNGQERRRGIIHALAAASEFDRVLETGTYRGTTTEFLLEVFGPPIHTVELNPRYLAYSRQRFASTDGVYVEGGDSREFLRRQAGSVSKADEHVFVYLDAHWKEDLPLVEELEIIATAWTHAIVMIDDFEVPDDPGYAFDDYGPGRRLTETLLPAEALKGWSLFYPSATSAEETGARRGCCVIASPVLADAANVPGLRGTRVF